jgi:hypothetical protein
MRPLVHFGCPVQLPYGKVSVAVKTEESAGGSSRISDYETNQLLSILSFVMHAPGFSRSFIQSWRLKENPLLSSPEKENKGEQQPENHKCNDHVRTPRGFQWLCMAGNLRQCEFR